MARFFDRNGREIKLADELGSGGEGAVYAIAGDPRRVAKIYHRAIPAEKAEKLRAMAALEPGELLTFASWPLEVLHDGRADRVAGIVLPRITGSDEIHKLYSPAQRKVEYPDKDWAFLLHAAMNCAAAFHAVHEQGHVIADVNQGNLLVNARGMVSLIDCDSFQVAAGGRTFPCEVGVPQFTPPELQGRSFRGLARSENHDRFGLALVIFHLLVMGRHPFAGRYLGRGEMPIERAIGEYRYVFGREAARLEMSPPPNCLPPERIAPRLAPLFERAFGRGSERPGARPSAADWHAALAVELAELTTCEVDRGHRIAAGLARCPWCEMMQGGGPNFFLSVTFRNATPAALEMTSELEALCRTFASAPRPRHTPAPPLPPEARAVRPTPPPPEVQSAESLTAMVRGVAIGSLLAMLVMVWLPRTGYVSVPIFLAFALWWLALFLISGNRLERHRRQKILRGRRGQLRGLERSRAAAISRAERDFDRVQKELAALRGQLAPLRKLHDAELHKRRRDVLGRRQTEYLQSQFIADHKIEGVGPGRQATLRSYGIETAADVEYNRVLGVPGMGPEVTNALCAWRTELLRKFQPDADRGLNPAERQALLLKYAQHRQRLEIKLRQGPPRLAELNKVLAARLAKIDEQMAGAQIALAQAQVDLAVMSPIEVADEE